MNAAAKQTESRWDRADLLMRALAPLALAGTAGWFIGNGDWLAAWRLAVLWILVLIFNAIRLIVEKLEGEEG